jgi:hypothetical protein
MLNGGDTEQLAHGPSPVDRVEPKKAALLRLSKIGADEMFGILLAQIFGGRVVAKDDSTSERL